MDESYIGSNEIDSIFELVIIVMYACIGIFCIQMFCQALYPKVDLEDQYDKVYADVYYDEVCDEVFRFTPYQVYMMGYYMDNWGPEMSNSITYTECNFSNKEVTLSPDTYGGNLVTRNNIISGSNNGGNTSVKDVLEYIRGSIPICEFYRDYTLTLDWTDYHSQEDVITDDGFHVIEERKYYKWVIDNLNPTNH